MAISFGRSILQRFDIDWAAAGFAERKLYELVEVMLRILQSLIVDPGRPARTGTGLRSLLAHREDLTAGMYPDFDVDQWEPARQPLWVVASAVAAILLAGVMALVTALAISIRPNVGTRSNHGPQRVVPTNPEPGGHATPPGASVPNPAPTAPPPAPRAVPPVGPQMPIHNPVPPAHPPGGERHGGGEGEGHGGGHGGGMPDY